MGFPVGDSTPAGDVESERKAQERQWKEYSELYIESINNIEVVERRDKETLLDIIKTYIPPGSTIYSDCWKSYDCLADEGFLHLTVNQSLHFKNPENDLGHKNAIEGTWSAIKRAIPSRSVDDQFDSYLAEYIWRKAQTGTDDLTRAFLSAAANVFPPRTHDGEESLIVLRELNGWLSENAFLTGTSPSSVDRHIFNLLYEQISSMIYAEKEKVIHLSRWYNTLQQEYPSRRTPISFSRSLLY